MASSSVPVVIAVSLFAFLGYGFYDFLSGFEENGCEMTYMYEYPQFVRIPLPPNITQKYPRYKLFVYGEGVYTEQLRDGKYNGIPVLFIPGNGGSYKQARSLASVAYRQAVDGRLRHHLNVFTLDLGEDLAGVYGRLLADQTRFAAECVRTILRLYRPGKGGAAAPAAVAVVGHSMGGVVARGLFALPGFDPASVRLLYLLAAPVAEPPVRIDRPMVEYYGWAEAFWSAQQNGSLAGVTVVSLSGGHRDVQVRPHQTAHPSSDITAVTTSVPGVWVSADHQCIVWCRQLVLTLARSLYDLVSPDTRQLISEPDTVRRVLRHHFVQRTHAKHFRNAFHPASLPMDITGEWKQYALRQWTFTADEVGRPTHLMIGLMNNPLYQRATLHAVNLGVRDWLLACVASRVERGVRMCDEGANLSPLGEQVPSRLGRRRSVSLDLQQLTRQGYTHVVVVVRPTDDKVTVHCDVSRRSDRQLTAEVPAFTSFRAFFQPKVVLPETAPGALSYNVSLQGLTDPWQAVRVHIRPVGSCGLNSQAALTFHVPWAQESRHVLLSGGDEGSITAKLQHPRPTNHSADLPPYVTAQLDPDCSYSISVQTSFPELWGQLARFFGPLLLPAALAVLLATLAEQLRAAAADQQLSAPAALAQLTPLRLVMPAQLLTSLLGWSVLAGRLPPPDLPSLAARGLTCPVLPFLLYFVSWTLVALLSLLAWGAVVLVGGVVHKISVGDGDDEDGEERTGGGGGGGRWRLPFLPRLRTRSRIMKYVAKMAVRMLSRCVGGSEAVAEFAVAGAARFPVLLSAGLSALAYSSCGEIALGIGLLICCVKLLQSYEEVLSGGGRPALLKAYTGVTLTLLWLWVTVVHLPCLLVWSRTRSESTQLAGDPSLVVALVLCNSGAVLWRESALRSDLAGFKVLATVVNATSIGVYLFAMVNVYRASWLASAVVMATALHQLLAPVAVREEAAEAAEGGEEVQSAGTADECQPADAADEAESAGEPESADDDPESAGEPDSAEESESAEPVQAGDGGGPRQRPAAGSGSAQKR